MSRPRGGFIGHNAVPAASALNSAASGVWTLREAEALKRAGTWPIAFVSPTQISGLQLWLDASDASTLFDATTGGSLVAADGGVARWEDKSGNGRNATQGTSADRPVRKTSEINGLDAIYFNGSSAKNFSATISGFRDYTALTMFFVIQPVAAAQANATSFVALRYSIRGYPPDGNDELALGFATGSIAGETICVFGPPGSGRLGSSSYTRAANTTSVFSLRTSSSGTSLRANGSDVTLDLASNNITTSSNFAPSEASSKTTDSFFIGSDGVSPEQKYCEIIIYNSALSGTDRSAVENYLLAKWGIT